MGKGRHVLNAFPNNSPSYCPLQLHFEGTELVELKKNVSVAACVITVGGIFLQNVNKLHYEE